MFKSKMTWGDRLALDLFLSAEADDLVSLLVDHDADCPLRRAAQRLMAVAKWSDEDLARAYFRKVQL